MTLARPAAASTTMAITRSCSSCVSVGASPVVPTGLKIGVPCAICHSTKRRKRRLVDRPVPERGHQGHGASGEDPTFGWHAFSRRIAWPSIGFRSGHTTQLESTTRRRMPPASRTSGSRHQRSHHHGLNDNESYSSSLRKGSGQRFASSEIREIRPDSARMLHSRSSAKMSAFMIAAMRKSLAHAELIDSSMDARRKP